MHESLKHILIGATAEIPLQIPAPDLIALSTILGSDEQAKTSWLEFRDRGFDLDSLYVKSGACLLPLLGKRLAPILPDEPWLGKMTGYYRHIWAKNHLEIRRLNAFLTELNASGIPCVVLNDTAIVSCAYNDFGSREIFCHRLLIREEHRTVAAKHIAELPESAGAPALELVYATSALMDRLAWSMTDAIDLDGQNVTRVRPIYIVVQTLLSLKGYCSNQTLWFLDMAKLASLSYSPESLEQFVRVVSADRNSLRALRAWCFFQAISQSVNFSYCGNISEALADLPITLREIMHRTTTRLRHEFVRHSADQAMRLDQHVN